METKTKQLEDTEEQIKNGSGSLLAQARKKQNKTVEEIAEELNLSISQIKTIELDQNEGLPEPTYVRGYIRSYAKLLGLDPEKVLERYLNPNWQKTSSLDDMPKGIGTADDNGNTSFISPGKVIFVLFVILIAAFLWFSGLVTDFLTPGAKPTPEKVVEVQNKPDTVQLNQVESQSQQEAPLSSVVDSSTELTQTSVSSNDDDPAESTDITAVEDNVIAEPEVANSLTLTFIQTCWVDIRDSNDKRLAFKSYSAGEELKVSNDGRLHVFLGNAEGVTAIYNGKPFDMTSYREGVYAKFSLGKK